MYLYRIPFKTRLVHLLSGVFLLIVLGACNSGETGSQLHPPGPTATLAPLIPPVIPPGVQERGFSLIPASQDEYNSQATLNALHEIRNLGANAVTLTTTYYTDTLTSSTIHTGRYTASDASLGVVIREAYALGLQVNLGVYVDPLTGEWRAYLAPEDRKLWFSQYAGILNHLATLAQQYKVHRLSLGAEMISLTTATANPDNTAEWENLILGVRSHYGGLIMYAADGGGSSNFDYEYAHIQFWKDVDEVGIDAYYPLVSYPYASVSTMEHEWSLIHDTILVPFAKTVQKPLVFAEVGYRSIVAAAVNPGDSKSKGVYDDCEQANAYDALLDFWKASKLLAGIFWWYWETSPNVGGNGDTSYSPRFKSASVILAVFWGSPEAEKDEEVAILQRCSTTG